MFGYQKNRESDENIWEQEWEEEDIPGNIRMELDFFTKEAKDGYETVGRDILVPPGLWGVQET